MQGRLQKKYESTSCSKARTALSLTTDKYD